MKEVSKEDLIRIQGSYRQKYGIPMDDWSASVLHEIHEHFKQLDSSVNLSIRQISKAGEAIKGSHKSVHFKSNWQAFYFGLGITGPASLASIVISVLIFWFSTKTQDYQSRKQIIDTYEHASEYVLLMENGKIIEKDGAKFLVLDPRPKKGDVKIGKEYIYDQPNKKVLVPLGRK